MGTIHDRKEITSARYVARSFLLGARFKLTAKMHRRDIRVGTQFVHNVCLRLKERNINVISLAGGENLDGQRVVGSFFVAGKNLGLTATA